MMSRLATATFCLCFVFVLAALCTVAATLRADEPPSVEPAAKAAEHQHKPIQALLITGGCCHDYDRQKLILTRGVEARTRIIWTVVHQGGTSTNTKIPLYEDPEWAKGFDVIVHNECFADVKDKEWVERILKPHREGVPAVLIHCAMHSYRTGDDAWFEFCGVQSPGHGPHYAYDVENIAADHPIMKGFGDAWRVPKGELYHTIKLFPNATPLAHAKRRDNEEPQVCIWTNEYGQGRVFATTIGHYNETMADETYLDVVTRGILWAAGRLETEELQATDDATNEEIRKLIDIPLGDTPQGPRGEPTPADEK